MSLRANRNTGAAPLMVFFDTNGTTVPSTTTAPKSPFLDLNAKWDFGDQSATGIQPWNAGIGGASRNRSTGPMAGHVYETPGTYTVSVTAADGAVAHRCSVTVEDPETVWASAATACFSGAGNFDGCPVGAQRFTTASFTEIAAKPTATNSIRRLLLRRGETFTAAPSGNLAVQGPGYIGGFGPGAAPRIALAPTTSADTPILRFSNGNAASAALRDWRVVGLHFDGTASPNMGVGVTAVAGIDQVSIVRNSFAGLRLAVITADGVFNFVKGHHMWDQWAVFDNRVDEMIPGTSVATNPYGAYMAGERLFFAGNKIDGKVVTGGISHATRFPYLGLAVISNNTFAGVGTSAHNIKLHAPVWGDGSFASTSTIGAGYSRWISISENAFLSTLNNWQVAIGSQGPEMDQRVRDVLVERNWHTFGTSTMVATLMFGVTDGAIRDNVVYAPVSKSVTGTLVGRRGTTDAAKPSTGIRVDHNLAVANAGTAAPYEWSKVEAGSTATLGENLAVRSACDVSTTPTFSRTNWESFAASTSASCAR